jgi:hypothetical protein
MGLPQVGQVSEQYSHHVRYDGISANPATGAAFTHEFLENLYGHRSGVGNSTPWSTPPVRPTPAAYQDANIQGAGGTSFTATTLVDTTKAWPVGDMNLGGTVTYAATTITDTARNNATGWVVGNTAQYAGTIVRTATGKIGIIASVAAGVATLTAAGWLGGTPAAGEQYFFYPMGWVGRTAFAVGAGGALTKMVVLYNIGTTLTGASWSNGTPSAGAAYILGPDAALPTATARFNDNWWATLRLLYNPANL